MSLSFITNDKEIAQIKNYSIITVVDIDTGEELVGVHDVNGGKYTNLNGDMIVQKNDIITLQFISYESVKLKVENDTIIKLKSL